MASRAHSLFVALFFLGTAAQAAPTASDRETARRLMDEGKARLRANDYAHAIEVIGKANDIMHVPTTGLALARAHLAAGHLVEARDAALSVEKMPHETQEPAVFEAARRGAADLVHDVRPRIPTLRVRIKGPATKLVIDGVEVPLAAAAEPIALDPGRRSIVVTGEGEARAEVDLAEHEAKEVELSLLAPAPIVAPPPPPPSPLPEREHGTRTGLAKGLLYGGFGVGLLGLGAGAVTGALTLSRANRLDAQCANGICAPSARSDLDTGKTLGTISTVAFIVGGVGLAAGIVGLLLPKTTRVALAPPGLVF